MEIRCIVTGQNESGKSVFVRDACAQPVTLSLYSRATNSIGYGETIPSPNFPRTAPRRRNLAISPQYTAFA